jgi:curved DNA-binding protein
MTPGGANRSLAGKFCAIAHVRKFPCDSPYPIRDRQGIIEKRIGKGTPTVAGKDFKDYYTILGVPKSADADEVKRAFRQLARKYHPDVNPGDKAAEEKFKEINEAYEVLSDTDKRRKYDQFGQYWKQAGAAPGGSGRSPAGGGGMGFDDFEFGRYNNFEDFINELLGRVGGGSAYSSSNYNTSNYNTSRQSPFGFNTNPPGGGGAGGAGPQLDMEAGLTLTLAEACNGAEKRINVGAETISVRIPAGAKSGSRIRVRGKGRPSPFMVSERGDLYLNVELSPHAFFQFDGETLTCELPITPDEAALGAQIEVPTLDGTVSMSIPAGVKSGQSMRLRGKGWKDSKGNRGDQMVKIMIGVPKDLSPIERELYEKLRANRQTDPRLHLKNLS